VGYTSSEKEEAVLRIVQGNPSYGRSSLATRRIAETYTQISELVQSAFLYESDAVFYLTFLSSNYYLRKARIVRSMVTELLDYTDDLLKPNHPIKSVTSINDARRALENIDGAISRHGRISSASWSRFDSAITKSRDEVGRAVKLNYTPRGSSTAVTDVVRPRDEARSLITSTFRGLKPSHASLIDGIEYLLDGAAAFIRSDVATSVARKQVARAETDLRDLYDTLEALTPTGRIPEARSALVRLLANRGAVKRLANAPVPGAPKLTSNVASPSYRAAAFGTGAAPVVTGLRSASWPIEDGVSDVLEVDVGGTTATIDIAPGTGYNPGVEPAEVVGTFAGDFKIGADLSTPYPFLTATVAFGSNYDVGDMTFYIVVDGVRHEVTFTPGSKTPPQLASEINLAIPDVLATPYSGGGVEWVEIAYSNAAPPVRYKDRYMKIHTGVNDAVTVPSVPPPNRPMGPMRIDGPSGIVVGTESKGWDANNQLWIVANDDQIAPAPAYVGVLLPSGPWPGYDVSVATVVGAITAQGVTKFEGDIDGGRVVVRSELKGEGSAVRILSGGVTGSPGRATPSHLGVQTLGFIVDQEDTKSDVWSQTVLNVLNQNVVFQAVATATAPRAVLKKSLGAVSSGAAQLQITLLDETDDPAADWSLPEIKLVVNGGNNSGVYGVIGTSWTEPMLTVDLDRNLRDQTVTNRHLVSVIQEALTITSKDASTAAYIDVATPAGSADVILGLPTVRTYGTVTRLLVEYNDPALGWTAADISRRGIRVGDKVVGPDGVDVATVTGINDAASGLLDVEGIDPGLSLLSGFTIESASGRDHDAFIDDLQVAFDGLTPFDDDDLQRIDRALAPVLIVDEPSKGQVNSAYATVEAYASRLDDIITVLGSFVIARVAIVDDALRSMSENGHDRARELLLQSRFEDYFGTTSRTASYSQTLMSTTSEVTVQDINEPTKHRPETEGEFERFMGGWEDDYDPSTDFADEEELPDTPLENYWPDEV